MTESWPLRETNFDDLPMAEAVAAEAAAATGTAAAAAPGKVAMATVATCDRGGGEHAAAVVVLVSLVDGWVLGLLPFGEGARRKEAAC